MPTPDTYDMVLTIADRAVTDIHLDRKLRATLLAADKTARPESADMLSDELATIDGEMVSSAMCGPRIVSRRLTRFG